MNTLINTLTRIRNQPQRPGPSLHGQIDKSHTQTFGTFFFLARVGLDEDIRHAFMDPVDEGFRCYAAAGLPVGYGGVLVACVALEAG